MATPTATATKATVAATRRLVDVVRGGWHGRIRSHDCGNGGGLVRDKRRLTVPKRSPMEKDLGLMGWEMVLGRPYEFLDSR